MEPNVNDFFILEEDNCKQQFNGKDAKKLQNLDNNPINGIKMSSTSDVTILPKAPPIITPTAISKIFPLEINSLNSFNVLPPFLTKLFFFSIVPPYAIIIAQISKNYLFF